MKNHNSFPDHFSTVAAAYREYRPTYPPNLFKYLASLARHHRLAWDCATGNGQAAIALAPYFDRIIATDASTEQIAQARVHPKIEYRVALAEHSGLQPHSVNLVTIAQAIHWFNPDAFYDEVRRVVVPGGVIAHWGYALMECEHSGVNQVIHDFYWDTLVKGNYWPPERRHLDNGYHDFPFPFEKIETPDFHLKVEWNLERLVNYLGTWSAVKEFIRREGEDPVQTLLMPTLPREWIDQKAELTFITPLLLSVGRLANPSAR